MVSLRDIKSDFPNWPDDVIEQWLLKFVNQPVSVPKPYSS